MTPEDALEELRAFSQPGKALQMAAYHKVDRVFLGVANPDIDAAQKTWRNSLDVSERVALADGLWQSGIFEARIAAAKLLTQARLRPDETAWALIQSWVPEFDCWALADHVCIAGQKRLIADPSRIEAVETWTKSEHMWTRRAAMVITLPWTKQNHPKPQDLAIRDRVLGWAAAYVADRDWFIQKSIGWWLRELSKHDRPRVEAFLEKHGQEMKSFARKEAAKYL
ncbi:DNA alkylation repair protein [Pseudohalocynthiibacter aestuariivivens]|jgi:3-methyladenine DNA glycosylase AlkD|uniref:DNA alkylation repair protein n=1 Tax=Pseudohalocynthiibacter aestuariivivens TaxID=1591409 RepID=A0ABV5JJ59_9RHOB|nr:MULTISPECIES: DNA alkylation repair protein [Pseudohalocynthiibacter]MBS9716724.1 DNA alkylation repair protein [Pseudohalocynthiibacter aestuariivivens]MCK0101807.1 DNA alkylation repair protein [Pseudohalocynthiibacter sp. F2068]